MSLTNNDGLITLLNKKWLTEIQPHIEKRKPEDPNQNKQEQAEVIVDPASHRKELLSSVDAVYADEDRAVMLFEAVKKIGNPDAIGTHYPMTWDDIIDCGFRGADDMKEKGITNLTELQKFVDERKKTTK